MKYRNPLAIAALVIVSLFSFQSSFAQNRNFGAQTFTMDDGLGHFFTMQAPAGLTGNLNYQFPTPPVGNPPAGFVNIGTAGQTLFWNATAGHNAWEASSVIQNNTNGNGSNVTITAPLIGAGASFTTLGASGLTTLSNTLYVRTATTAVNGDAQAVAIRSVAPGGSWTGAGAFGGANATVILGEIGGLAQLGGHNNILTSWQNLYINSGGANVRIGSSTAPTNTLDITGSLGASGAVTFAGLNTLGVVHNSNTGLLSTSLVSLTADVSGILPIANGGTGSASQIFVDLTTAQSVGGNKTFTGTTTANTFASSGATITGGSINGTPIGGTTAAAGTFTSVTASGNITSTGGNHGVPATTSFTVGTYLIGGSPALHEFGGNSNLYVGSSAGNFTTGGVLNTGVGSGALGALGAGNQSENTAVGNGAMSNASTSLSNTAVGVSAMAFKPNVGIQNVAVGKFALASVDGSGGGGQGSQNVSLGYQAGNNLTSGSNNTMVGTNTSAGVAITGNNNTALGSGASVGAAVSNATAIGNGAQALVSNTIVLGNNAVTAVNANAPYNTNTGYQIGAAAASGNYLRGNGTNFVSSAIQAADLPAVYLPLAGGTMSGGINMGTNQITNSGSISLDGSASRSLFYNSTTPGNVLFIQSANNATGTSAITMQTGQSTAAGVTGPSGQITIASGTNTAGSTGSVVVTSGFVSVGAASGASGDVTIATGSVAGTATPGTVLLAAGGISSAAALHGGNVGIVGGNSVNGPGGSIFINPGSGAVAGQTTITGQVNMANAVITGGSLNGTPIGAGTRSTGAFTTLAANNLASLTGGASISSGASVAGGLNVSSGGATITGATTVTGNLSVLSPTATANTLSLQAPSSGNSTTFVAQTQAGGTITYTLPAAPPTPGQVLTAQTAVGNNATLNWAAGGGGGAVTFTRVVVPGGTTYGAAATDNFIGCSTTAGAVTINLPSAVTAGVGHTIIIKDEGYTTNGITVNAAATQTVEDNTVPGQVAGFTFNTFGTGGSWIHLYSDGVSKWYQW